ncbi:ArsR/SmtB family transcription factor [Micromonospora sp. NPDC003197]
MTSGLTHPCASLFDDGKIDLLTVTGPAGTIEEGLTALLAAHPEHFRTEFAAFVKARRRDQLRSLAPTGDLSGNLADRLRLATFLNDYHRVAVAPHWSQISARLSAEGAALTQTLGTQGVDGLLARLAPFARWRAPVLEVGGTFDRDVTLDGKGLLLVPTAFHDSAPTVWFNEADHQKPPLLFLPVMRDPGDLAATLVKPSEVNRLAALVKLLGRTRAHALDSIGTGPCTTAELARRLAASPANASEHATVLRDAGLIATTRQGQAVRHQLTALGEQLLHGTSVGVCLPGGSVSHSALTEGGG